MSETKWAGPKPGGGAVTAIGTVAGKEALENQAAILHQLAAVIDVLVVWIRHLTMFL